MEKNINALTADEVKKLRSILEKQEPKKKFKSMFDNNMDGVATQKLLAGLKNEVEILKKQVKLITTELNQLKRDRQ